MSEDRSLSGRFTNDARRRELVRQLMRARRPMTADPKPTGAADPAKASLLAKVKPSGAT